MSVTSTVRTSVVVANGAEAIATYSDLINSERKRLVESFENIAEWAAQLARAAGSAACELEKGP